MKKIDFWILGAGAFLYLSIAYFNFGFIASDEYWHSILRYIPAQTSSLGALVPLDDMRSAFQNLPMHGIAQTLHFLGINHPFRQYEGVILVTSLFHYFLLILGVAVAWSHDSKNRTIGWICVSCYGFAPFILTRPMFESLAAPWLFLSAAFLMQFERNLKNLALILSAICVCFAFAFRPQAGICGAVILLIALLHSKKKASGPPLAILVGGVGFFFLGWLDSLWRGEFHGSLIAMSKYNFENGTHYGQQPWYFYFPILIGLFLTPFFWDSFKLSNYGNHFRWTRAPRWMLAAFVLFHMIFPHKFERFLIPVIPLILLILTPLVSKLWENYSQHRLRFAALAATNILILLVTGFQIPHQNILKLTNYLDRQPLLKDIISYKDSVDLLPDVFMQDRRINLLHTSDLQALELNCSSAVVINEFYLKQFEGKFPSQFQLLAEFPVNWIDDLSFKLNQKHNRRRNKLFLFGGCASKEPRQMAQESGQPPLQSTF